jgi:hypothetical protein
VTDRALDPVALVRDADPAELPELLGTLLQAQALAFARMIAERRSSDDSRTAAPDVNLSAEEAARRLGVSIDFLYKAKKLPFRRHIGRRVVFSAAGLERWNRQREGRS